MQLLEGEAARWKKAAEDKRAVGETDRAGQERAVATAREVASLKREIDALKEAVRFFREENGAVRRREVEEVEGWLRRPLVDPRVGEVVAKEEALEREAREVLGELRALVREERVLDLKTVPEDRMRWRPMAATPRWTCARQRERYEAVKAWKENLMGRVEAQQGVGEKTGRRRRRWDGGGVLEAARVRLALPVGYDVGKGMLEGQMVAIRDPESWEELEESLTT